MKASFFETFKIFSVLFVYQPIKSTLSLNLDLVANLFPVSSLYCFHVPFTAWEYPKELDGLFEGIILKIFFLGGLASQSKFDSILIIANWIYIGVPHFCSTFLVCLYQKYRSSKITQLLTVVDGIEEHPDKKINDNMINLFFILVSQIEISQLLVLRTLPDPNSEFNFKIFINFDFL